MLEFIEKMYSNIYPFPGYLTSKAYNSSLGYPHLLVHGTEKYVLTLPQRFSKVCTVPAFLKIHIPILF
jgi:hypothetical protein